MAVTVKNGYIKMTAAGDTYSADSIAPLFFRWYAADTAGDTLTLNDYANVELYRSVANGAYFTDMVPYGQNEVKNPKNVSLATPPLKKVRLKLATIDSGILEVHYRVGG